MRQRAPAAGPGRSAPLVCDEVSPTQPLADAVDPARLAARLTECRTWLQKLPHGDLRHYTTVVAMQDAYAVRRQLGADTVNTELRLAKPTLITASFKHAAVRLNPPRALLCCAPPHHSPVSIINAAGPNLPGR